METKHAKRKGKIIFFCQIFIRCVYYPADLYLTKLAIMDLAVIVDVFMALMAYMVTDNLISSRSIKDGFIKANLFGKDLNKTSEDKV